MSSEKKSDLQSNSEKKESLTHGIIAFFQNIFLGKGDADYERKKLLKNVKRQLKSLKIQVLNTRYEKVTPKFAEMIFDIYRYTNPLKSVININPDKQTKGKIDGFFVEVNLNEKQLDMLKVFEKEYMLRLVGDIGLKEMNDVITKTFHDFQQSFTKELIDHVNVNYTNLNSLNNLIQYDLYPILKKFAPKLKENVISDPPKFREMEGKYISDFLYDLSELLYSINLNGDYQTIINQFGQLRGVQLLPEKDVKKFIDQLKELVGHNYIPLIISYVQKDPHFRPVQNIKQINLIRDYFKDLTIIIKNRRDEVIKQLKTGKINKLSSELFNKTEITTMKNYNYKYEEPFRNAEIGNYLYIDAINFLKYYLMEKYNRYIRENINKLVVNGKFSDQHISEDLSSGYYHINEMMKNILALDDSIDDTSKLGAKIKSLLRTAQSDKANQKALSDHIKQTDKHAKSIMNESVGYLSSITIALRGVLEDYKKNTRRVILNVKKINGGENRQFIENIVKAYNETSKLLVLIKIVMPVEVEKIEEK